VVAEDQDIGHFLRTQMGGRNYLRTEPPGTLHARICIAGAGGVVRGSAS
jgi:hypothetical protein